jgi:hypothetical protein
MKANRNNLVKKYFFGKKLLKGYVLTPLVNEFLGVVNGLVL